MTRAPILAALVLAACGDAASPGFSTGPGITSVAASTSGSSTAADTTSTGPADDSAGSSGSSSTGTLRDVGAETDFGVNQPLGCKGKVDLLFVISRLHTMVTEQDQLLASFPGFIDTIEQKLEGFDVHIMTANPDAYWPGWTCENQACIGEKYWPNCGPNALDYQCGVFAEMTTACDEQLGAGLIFNAGGYAANKLCDLYGGHRFIISGEPDMASAFECIAKVGVSGKPNKMGDAVIAALSPAPNGLNGPGGCNEGFLREDALLVVAFITDTSDYSKSYAKQQYEAIVAAKKDPSAVVLLAVVPQPHKEGEPEIPGCTYDWEGLSLFHDLGSKFPYAVYGDTCAPSYASFFDAAADKISEACGSFIPQ
ncbi:MAG: hypothetical protein H0X44_01890 [Acidobacteria bacterium]|nr:hypothetical protein [Acidobacteriota bacterium]